MDPIMMFLAFLAMKGRGPSSPAPQRLNGHAGAGDSESHEPAITLRAGGLYRIVGTLAEGAPKPEQIKQMLRMLAGTKIAIRGDAISWTMRLPMDVPFSPGSAHPRAPWLRLESATEIKSKSK